MIHFNKNGFTIVIKTNMEPVDVWQELHHELLDLLLAMDTEITEGCPHQHVLSLLQQMMPDRRVATRMQNE